MVDPGLGPGCGVKKEPLSVAGVTVQALLLILGLPFILLGLPIAWVRLWFSSSRGSDC